MIYTYNSENTTYDTDLPFNIDGTESLPLQDLLTNLAKLENPSIHSKPHSLSEIKSYIALDRYIKNLYVANFNSERLAKDYFLVQNFLQNSEGYSFVGEYLMDELTTILSIRNGIFNFRSFKMAVRSSFKGGYAKSKVSLCKLATISLFKNYNWYISDHNDTNNELINRISEMFYSFGYEKTIKLFTPYFINPHKNIDKLDKSRLFEVLEMVDKTCRESFKTSRSL